ncbi:hypothetical protein CONLIGDRAFT_215334 [Coniochaeta ligniaria NRRL 30616]|uniref:Uncharacterized protein n=1 Tax=Coniochaeta ligniaria NRRL 30616 TaxID=1408157 RepID=A0A1J7I4M1_9PEZI|nr:hypothetical protein CONLIGDRAFT_215334 [Coniochaeta ligniaria NRRL 30616]
MPTTDRRATYRSRYEPEYSAYDSYSEDDYPAERRPRPRRKSTTRDIIDRVSRSIGRLGIDRSPSRTRRARVVSPSPSPPPRRPAYNRHRSAESYYPPSSRPRNKRHGSSYSMSPPRTRGSTSRSTTRDRSPVDDRRFKHAARSALDAAVVEVMRVRKEPGSWTGGKGARVATAALGAAAVDAFVAKDPDKHGKRKTVESTIGGLLLNRMVNGPRRELRKESRSRR